MALSGKELMTRILAAGCVGLNFEDTDHARGKGQWVPAERQAERIAAIREAARAEGVPIVINARVDMYIGGPLQGDARREEAIRRGKLYLAAGADCVYPIIAHEDAEIAALVKGIGGPVNVMALPTAPPLARLSQLGVARVTFGSLREGRVGSRIGCWASTCAASLAAIPSHRFLLLGQLTIRVEASRRCASATASPAQQRTGRALQRSPASGRRSQ